MITFKSRNIDGEIREWKFNSVKELEEAWNSPDADVPANDDVVWDIKVNDKNKFGDTYINVRNESDGFWFEDMLTGFGIEIWQ